MADYFTHFPVMLPLCSADRIEPALTIYHELVEQLERDETASKSNLS